MSILTYGAVLVFVGMGLFRFLSCLVEMRNHRCIVFGRMNACCLILPIKCGSVCAFHCSLVRAVAMPGIIVISISIIFHKHYI